jgi:hypothetical protein
VGIALSWGKNLFGLSLNHCPKEIYQQRKLLRECSNSEYGDSLPRGIDIAILYNIEL